MNNIDDDPFGGEIEDIFGDLSNNENKTSEEVEIWEPRNVSKFKDELIAKGKEAEDDLTDFDVLVEDLDTVHAKRVNKILGNMTDINFMSNYLKLLSYVKPKYKAVDAEQAVPTELTSIQVTVINNKDELNE